MVSCDELAMIGVTLKLLPLISFSLRYHVIFGVGIPEALQIKEAELSTLVRI